MYWWLLWYGAEGKVGLIYSRKRRLIGYPKIK
jgi:hypothetical protein